MVDVSHGDGTIPTVSEALHATLDLPFEDAVRNVQLEHELAGSRRGR